MAEFASPESDSVFVPLVAPVPLFVCELLHCMVHVKVFPSGSLMGMLHVRPSRLLVESFDGEGVPNTGGRFAFVVKVYHFRV